MNINFNSEEPFHPYRVDLYLPEWHFVIEVDGPQHSPKKDLIRDQTLEIAYGLRVLHIPTGKRKQEVIDLVTQAAENWAEDAENRKRSARQPA